MLTPVEPRKNIKPDCWMIEKISYSQDRTDYVIISTFGVLDWRRSSKIVKVTEKKKSFRVETYSGSTYKLKKNYASQEEECDTLRELALNLSAENGG